MPGLDNRRLRVFVSYPGQDGLEKAKEAAAILASLGHTPWLYEEHRTLGATVFREIAISIRRKTDVLFYICTNESLMSWGQQLEAGYALSNRYVKIIVVVLDDAQVPDELTAFNYTRILGINYVSKVRVIAEELPSITERIQRLEEEIKAVIE